MKYRVGEHLVDPGAGEITGPSGTVHVEPRVMAVLGVLADKAGETVSKSALLHGVWNDLYVTEDCIHRAIGLLRKALGDDDMQHRVILTVPKQGYRLTAQVEQLALNGEPKSNGSSELTLEAVLSSCSDHIYVYDEDGRYLHASRAGAAAMGFAPRQMSGRNWRDLGMSEQIMEPFDRKVRDVFKSSTPVRSSVTYPTIDGNRTYEYALNPIAGNGKVVAVVAVVREMAEARRPGGHAPGRRTSH